LNHNSPNEIRSVLAALGARPKKRWGQNFMVNPRTREKLVTTLDPQPDDVVWEVGPGLGALSEALAERCARLVLFEIDNGLIGHLQETVAARSNVTLVQGDFMKTWNATEKAEGQPDRIVGNLPFSSSSAIISALAESQKIATCCVFTVQKELAERITAAPGTRNYSSFSVLCQVMADVEGRGELAPGTFYPVPEVTSAVVEMRPPAQSRNIQDREFLLQLIRAVFAARRKTLRNNLLKEGDFIGLPKAKLLEVVEATGIDAGVRAEELSPELIVSLANALAAARAAEAN
jgi:16S rRNA (adenine1518-N6/adenine1519-N6)-dimethyltransferase